MSTAPDDGAIPRSSGGPLDRRGLVGRHDVRRVEADPLEPLSVGNGEFAFTADVTGLQSLTAFHESGMPLHTQAQWAWHSAPDPEGYTLEDAYEDYRDAAGRTVPYLTTGLTGKDGRHERAAAWLRQNPHRIDLGRIGFTRPGGEPLRPEELSRIRQHLDLWQGRLDSAFTLDGRRVRVSTACHPELNLIAIRADSALLLTGDLEIRIRFPYAAGDWSQPCVWDADAEHRTELAIRGERADLRRILDEDVHHVALVWSPGLALRRSGEHNLVLRPAREAEGRSLGPGMVELTVGFAPEPLPEGLPTVADTLALTARHWAAFWSSGGAMDLSGSTDPRASELERRIVLSRYLTAINCAGSTPPAETGLVTNSWRGKFHLEMHWWHAAHFALWGQSELLARSLRWYERILPVAREYAARQGYRGVRWPKQVGPEARESPSDVGAFLIWQQPHPIYFAELLRRTARTRAERADVLRRYRPLVLESAEFMASYPVHVGGRYHLGPPLASAQEQAFRLRGESRNPAFELAYWRWALRTAQEWRHRLGLESEPAWDEVADGLAPLPVRDGRYAELEHPVTRPENHPSMVGALGFVPDTGVVDHDVMRATLRYVLDSWELKDTWGWDYPLLAMTAARLGESGLAVDALLLDSPKNRYLANGHNFQESPRLPLYLPGNGGVLYATAMLAAGWDGAPSSPHPGFPDHGWQVRYEGLFPSP